MLRALLLLLVFSATIAISSADELTRRMQEELRKRNLYFGDVNGQPSPELSAAIRHYQERKGFTTNGEIDEETAGSLHLSVSAPSKNVTVATRWPDVPVLKSDSAPEISEQDRTALQAKANTVLDAPPSPPPPAPAESPDGSQNLDPARVQKFVEDYLRDGETDNLPAQLSYYTYPVDYFGDGRVGRDYVERDTRRYNKRWPERKFMVAGPVTFAAAGTPGETLVEFTTAFSVRNKTHAVPAGKSKNYWTIRPEGDSFRITAIRDERLRE